jgi:quercetin dioxygenase-like cupin family protein
MLVDRCKGAAGSVLLMIQGDGFQIAHRDELERTGGWSLVRRTLGVASFGINLVEIEPGGEIPEHDEAGRDQEEVFVVLDGDATMVIDGDEQPAPAGTFVRLAPERRRTVRNHGSAPVTVLIASAPRTSGYEPMEWA